MIRINLLPPEILEKRQAESRRLYLLAISLVVLTVLGFVWAFMAVIVQTKSLELASKQQQAAALQSQADKFKVFEDRTRELKQRQTVAEAALAGRVDWSRLVSDVTLVLPTDMWLTTLVGTESEGLKLEGWSLDSGDNGFKSIAKLLVRLTDLEQLQDAWLTTAEKKDVVTNQPAIGFSTMSKIKTTATSVTTSAVPPPPPAAP